MKYEIVCRLSTIHEHLLGKTQKGHIKKGGPQ